MIKCRLTAPVSAFRRVLVVLLVALAASPLTAPFATYDVLDLVDHDGSASITAMKPPKAHDVVTAIAAPRPLTHQPIFAGILAADPTGSLNLPSQVSFPLRL